MWFFLCIITVTHSKTIQWISCTVFFCDTRDIRLVARDIYVYGCHDQFFFNLNFCVLYNMGIGRLIGVCEMYICDYVLASTSSYWRTKSLSRYLLLARNARTENVYHLVVKNNVVNHWKREKKMYMRSKSGFKSV